jgi:hypothetical protein
MTVPRERLNSIGGTREFLLALLNAKETPKVPSVVRRRALACLRHFPTEWDMGPQQIKRSFYESER